MSDELVLIEVEDDGVALLTLNRPDRLNAWTLALQLRFFDLLKRCAEDPEVRVIVLTGAGRGFSAGADTQMMKEGVAGGAPLDSVETPQWLITELPKPVIAAINGPCAGMGLIQALYCDIRFAAAGAKFTTAFARRGLIAEHGISWTLPRTVGIPRAMDLLLSARVFYAEEALEMGLVNAVLPKEQLLDHAMSYAKELAIWSSPAAMAAIKRQVWDDLGTDLPRAALESDRLLQACVRAPDFAEGVASFVEKRPPRFDPIPRLSTT